MSSSFFSLSEVPAAKLQPSLLPKCGRCGLLNSCQSPKMPVSGRGLKRVLVVGEAPGAEEDKQGTQFVGRAGQFLQSRLDSIGIDLKRDCWVTNSIICRPPGNKITNEKVVDFCRPNLLNTINELQPDVIILLGKRPVTSLIGAVWKDDTQIIGKWTGWQIPCARINAYICPTWHPSYVMREIDAKAPNAQVLDHYFREHLAAAFALRGKPFTAPPDYQSKVKRILSPDEAADKVRAVTKASQPVAWDIETNALKPYYKGAEVVCCSFSNDKESFAFPWYGAAKQAVGEFLDSKCPKLGWNQAFETVWALSEFGKPPRNWLLDGMLAAHTLDNRKGVKGLKFQSFVRLGVEDYDSTVKPYLEAVPGSKLNRIRELSIAEVLDYCAMDSLLEWELCHILAKELGVSL